jgi:hypothetical protein
VGRDDIWGDWRWTEPILRRELVPLQTVPGYRGAVRRPGTKGSPVLFRVIGWEEWPSVTPWLSRSG